MCIRLSCVPSSTRYHSVCAYNRVPIHCARRWPENNIMRSFIHSSFWVVAGGGLECARGIVEIRIGNICWTMKTHPRPTRVNTMIAYHHTSRSPVTLTTIIRIQNVLGRGRSAARFVPDNIIVNRTSCFSRPACFFTSWIKIIIYNNVKSFFDNNLKYNFFH